MPRFSSEDSFQQFTQIFQYDDNNSSQSTSRFGGGLEINIQINHHPHRFELNSQNNQPNHFQHTLYIGERSWQEQCSDNSNSISYEEQCSIENEENHSNDFEGEVHWRVERGRQNHLHDQESFSNSFNFSMSLQESDNFDSPFFIGTQKPQGMTNQQINNIPIMTWSTMHNKFNGGERCSVCLAEFQIADKLRVMTCLHRYHLRCLDQWLEIRANCPNCRNHAVSE